MTELVRSEYLAASADAEAALESLAKARVRAQAAMNNAAKTNSMAEKQVMGANYGMHVFDQAIQQSAGAKGLVSLFEGGPERAAQVGVRVGGNVEELMKERLGVADHVPPASRKRAEEGREHEPKKINFFRTPKKQPVLEEKPVA